MRRILALTLFASAFAFSGCAVQSDADDSEIDTSESAGALSAYGKGLVGTFETADSASPFDRIVLRKDGTYTTTEMVQCFAKPCLPLTNSGKFIGYAPKAGSKIGGLRLVPTKTGTVTYYRVVLSKPNASFQLYADGRWFDYYERPRCDHTATATRKYVGTSESACMSIRFACEPGWSYFSNACGCGCTTEPPPPPPNDCRRDGCSGEVCSEPDAAPVISICMWREEYACLAKAPCERQADGACGFTKTAELSACLAAVAP